MAQDYRRGFQTIFQNIVMDFSLAAVFLIIQPWLCLVLLLEPVTAQGPEFSALRTQHKAKCCESEVTGGRLELGISCGREERFTKEAAVIDGQGISR